MEKAVIFDMDGTLWDSVDNIAYSWSNALDGLNIPSADVKRERLLGLMGQTMDRFAAVLLPQYSPEEGMKILDRLEQAENDYLREQGAELLGDVEDTFRCLHDIGCFVGIVSNSQSGYIEAFLDHYHLEGLVDDILCYGDTQLGKAENIGLMIDRNMLDADNCIYVGDTAGDYDACLEAGVHFIWAAYGFGTVDGDVPRIDSLGELIELMK